MEKIIITACNYGLITVLTLNFFLRIVPKLIYYFYDFIFNAKTTFLAQALAPSLLLFQPSASASPHLPQ